MKIELTWENPVTGEYHQQVYDLPLALGRDASKIPDLHDGQQLSKAIFNSSNVSKYHALINFSYGNLSLQDFSMNGTKVNTKSIYQSSCTLNYGDVIEIRPYKITFKIITTSSPTPTNINSLQVPPPTIIFNPENDSPDPHITVSTIPISSFPPPQFLQPRQVNVQQLHTTGDPVEEGWDYLALGGGLGSFAWVNHLRIYGVSSEKIAVVGLDTKPYGRYQRLCQNSQIPMHERLRSGSDSCPDNIWGWPGYAWREAWQDLLNGRLTLATRCLWQVFAEPVLVDTYTPKSGKVFDSIDREAQRIGWSDMFRYGRIRNIRQTDDDRYAIAYSVPEEKTRQHRYIVGKYIHISTGYPAIRFLKDLQEYRATTGDFKSVVNAYEKHGHVYGQLQKNGGTVIIRGKGIVASRIIQRIYEVRQKNSHIIIIHVTRTRTPEGAKFGLAQRKVDNHWEFQPYNWPKSLWGGDLRGILESASPQKREQLLKDWGGTTTADRSDWRRMIQQGLDEGWYFLHFGTVEKVERNSAGKPLTFLRTETGLLEVEADFIIDCTGLEANPKDNPLFKDLIDRYNLPLNPFGRLQVKNDFEIHEMLNGKGRMYTAGVLTLGGPYAPVDSFLGLQYAAQRSVDSLVRNKAPNLKYLDGVGSFWQWCKWALNQEP